MQCEDGSRWESFHQIGVSAIITVGLHIFDRVSLLYNLYKI